MARAEPSGIEIRHEESGDRGAFFVQADAGRLAELTYSRLSPGVAVLEHTEVSDALRGSGVGRMLVEAAVDWARRTTTRLEPRCSYAKSLFDRYPALRDVLE